MSDNTQSRLREIVGTEATEEQSLSMTAEEGDARRAGWQRMIDDYLVEWGLNPGKIDEDGYLSPDRDVIHRACDLAMALRDGGWAPPTRVIQDGEGGIAFERHAGKTLQSLELHPGGVTELLTFEGGRLQSRRIFESQEA